MPHFVLQTADAASPTRALRIIRVMFNPAASIILEGSSFRLAGQTHMPFEISGPPFVLQWLYAIPPDSRVRNRRAAGGDVAGDGEGQALGVARIEKSGDLLAVFAATLSERARPKNRDVCQA